MKCINCGEEMKCCDDVNNSGFRVDWLKCPNCKSEAEIIYKNNGSINKLTWKRKDK